MPRRTGFAHVPLHPGCARWYIQVAPADVGAIEHELGVTPREMGDPSGPLFYETRTAAKV